MRRHVLRWTAGIVTAVLTTWLGLLNLNAHAESAPVEGSTCTRSDVAVYEKLMEYPEEEATPAYVLAVSEAFLQTCADHPDARNIHLRAAIASLDSGHARRAIHHLEASQTYGYELTSAQRFGMVAALLATGQEDKAWATRDQAVEAWIAGLEDDGLAAIEVSELTGGTLYEIRFDAAENEKRIRAIWLAVPEGRGWPAAVSLGSDRFRAAMHAVRAGPDAERLEHLDFVRCRSRYVLTKSEGAIPIDESADAAKPLLEAYLAQPDRLEWTEENAPVAACIWPGEMLPRPDPWKATAIN